MKNCTHFTKKTYCLLIFTFFCACKILNAQVILNGEFRPRFEYRHGYKTIFDTSSNAASFISQRTRLNLRYKHEKLETYISLQDVRTWGSQPQQVISDGLTSMHEGWVDYSFTDHLSFKAGRQEIIYDDHRIFGNVDWAQQARSHDLLLLKFNDSTLNIHVGIAYNQDKEQSNTAFYTINNSYRTLQFLWLHKGFKNISASILILNNGIQSPVGNEVSRYSQTIGTHIQFIKEKLRLIVKGYYQTGIDGSKKQINAYLAGGELNYTFSPFISAAIGTEVLSGQSQTDSTISYSSKVHYFTPFYTTGHKFNGYMDYFYAGNSHGNVGLNDLYIRINYKKEKYFIQLESHYFQSAANVLDVNYLTNSGNIRTMDNMLGTEIDFTCAYKFQKNVNLQLGYSQMFATKTLETIKGGGTGQTNNWAYLMLVVQPEFFKQ